MAIIFYLYKFFGWLFNLLVVIIGALLLAAGIYATTETSKIFLIFIYNNIQRIACMSEIFLCNFQALVRSVFNT